MNQMITDQGPQVQPELNNPLPAKLKFTSYYFKSNKLWI